MLRNNVAVVKCSWGILLPRKYHCGQEFFYYGIAKILVSTFTYLMILSFLTNCTPCCRRATFQHINLEIISATEATDSSLRASASVAMYSFPNSFRLDNLYSIEIVIYPCSKSNIQCKHSYQFSLHLYIFLQ